MVQCDCHCLRAYQIPIRTPHIYNTLLLAMGTIMHPNHCIITALCLIYSSISWTAHWYYRNLSSKHRERHCILAATRNTTTRHLQSLGGIHNERLKKRVSVDHSNQLDGHYTNHPQQHRNFTMASDHHTVGKRTLYHAHWTPAFTVAVEHTNKMGGAVKHTRHGHHLHTPITLGAYK